MNSSAVSFFCRTILKKVATYLFVYSAVPARCEPIKPGEMGSIFTLLGIFTDDRLSGPFSLTSLLSLLKDPPREVLRAEPILTSMGEISSWMEERLLPAMSGSIFLGSSSRNDFFLVCWVRAMIHRREGWFPARDGRFAYYCWRCSWICRGGWWASASGTGCAATLPSCG